MSEKGKIYIIRNKINSKVYIGQTTRSLSIRFSNHLSAAKHSKGYVIGKAIRKYGAENFYIELLEECNIDSLNEREKHWIAFFNSTNSKFGYNMSIGGNHPYTNKVLDSNKVIELFNSGMPVYKVARILHTDISKVTTILKQSNIRYGLALQKMDTLLESMIIDLYLDGYSTVDIGRRFNINKSTVRRILLRNNIEIRPWKESRNLKRNPSALNNISDPRESCI